MAKKAAKGAAAKKKRTVSGRRGKPGRKNNQGTDTRGVVGIVVFCIGFLALLCQFIPSDGGFLNRCMLVVRGLGGMLCLLRRWCSAGRARCLSFSGRKSGVQER